ncbi:hypothetical protein D3C80_1042770 [compost metagenome]
MALGRHGTGHVRELLKVWDPEVFVDVDVAGTGLGTVGVGGAEVQLCPVRQHDGVAGQGDAQEGLGNLADVGAEHLRLSPGGRQENLVAAGQHRIFQRLAGEVVGHADLAGLEDVARARQRRVVLGLPHPQLIAEQGAQPLGKVIGRQVSDLVLGLLAALAATACLTALLTLAAAGPGFMPLLTLDLEGLLALGPLERLLFEADMVADEPVQLLLLARAFLLPVQ